MAKIINFDFIGFDSLKAKFSLGLAGYSINTEKHIGLSTLWLLFGGGEILRIHSVMTELDGWNEIGSLVFSLIKKEEDYGAPIITLPKSWLNIDKVDKLVIDENNIYSECGLNINNKNGETMIIVCSSAVFRIELQAPFFVGPFQPEYEMARYKRISL